MNDLSHPSVWDGLKFGVGQPVRRTEDPVLVRGEGAYTDDLRLDGQVYAALVRSVHAHGFIKSIDLTAAKALPGVLGAWTAADLAKAGCGVLKCGLPGTSRDGSPMLIPARHALAADRVRFVGDPFAFVVARTAAGARDAAEAVTADIETLPAVVDARAALAKGAPQLYDAVPGNFSLDYHTGDSGKTAAAFAKAHHVTRLEIANNRVVVNALEPRGALASFDKRTRRFTLRTASQGAFKLRDTFADVMGIAPAQMHLITPHVGGSFGMKGSVFPEYVCILFAARELGLPVKITNDRATSFVADYQGRGSHVTAELALDRNGRFLATRYVNYVNLGAYLTPVGPMMQTRNILINSASVYTTPVIEVSSVCAFTNTVPVAAYRGAGRPEGNYYMERLIDKAAREMGLDAVRLRRLNHIKPEALPYKAASGLTYDSGNFTRLLKRAQAAADWPGFAARKRASNKRGLLRGRGLGQFLESTAGLSKEMGGIRFDADGGVTMISGTLDYGQGHTTTFGQILHGKLGIPLGKIRLVQGDSDALIVGGGTGGSRSTIAGGTAIFAAADEVIAKGRKIAAHVLEAGEADIEFANGRFVIAGTDRSIGLTDLAAKLRSGLTLPAHLPQELDAALAHDGVPPTFPNGCHVCEVEVDPETGSVRIDRYISVNDFGTLVNPLLVEGQMHGGIVQGIGQALMENTVFDEDGQLLTGSFMDYALPRAADVPMFGFESMPSPAKTNPLGAKGCGEAGCAGSLPSVMHALIDALAEFGVSHMDMPATPEKVWRAIHGGNS